MFCFEEYNSLNEKRSGCCEILKSKKDDKGQVSGVNFYDKWLHHQHHETPAVVVGLVDSALMLDDDVKEKISRRRKGLSPAITLVAGAPFRAPSSIVFSH